MNNNDLTFENAIARIEEITALLSSGNVSLDESINLYSEASALLVHAKEKLLCAKLKVEEITSFIERAEDESHE